MGALALLLKIDIIQKIMKYRLKDNSDIQYDPKRHPVAPSGHKYIFGLKGMIGQLITSFYEYNNLYLALSFSSEDNVGLLDLCWSVVDERRLASVPDKLEVMYTEKRLP